MEFEQSQSTEAADAVVVKVKKVRQRMRAPRARFDVVCFDKDGVELWRDVSFNVVTTVGKIDLLDKYLAGSAYTAAWFCGLISSVGYSAVAAADTMASHAGWNEAQGATNVPDYSSSTRVALTFAAAAASGANATKATSSASSFTFSSAGTIKGMFNTSVSTKGGTTGVLYNGVLFTGGDRIVAINDVVNVSVTYTIT